MQVIDEPLERVAIITDRALEERKEGALASLARKTSQNTCLDCVSMSINVDVDADLAVLAPPKG